MSEQALSEDASKTERDEALESLASKHKQNRDEELGLSPDEPAEEEEPEQLDANEPENYETLVIDGEETQVERDKIYDTGKRALQKELAADKRLQEAAQAKREAEELKAKLEAAYNAGFDESQPSDDVDEIADAIYLGDEDQIKQAVKRLKESSQIDPQKIREEARDQFRFESAMEKFSDKYSEIVEDPNLFQLAVNLEQKKRQDGDDRSYWDLFDEVGKEVLSWRESIAGSTDKGDIETKRNRKKEMDSFDSSNAPPNPQGGPKPKTPEEIISEMRAARNQP